MSEEGLRASQWQGKAAQRFGQVSTAGHMGRNWGGVKDGGGASAGFRLIKTEQEGLDWRGRNHARKRELLGIEVAVRRRISAA